MQASLETTLSVVQEQLQSTELQLSDSRSTLSDEKTTLETQIESHKKQLALIQAEFEGEKVSNDYNYGVIDFKVCLLVAPAIDRRSTFFNVI